MSWIYYLLEANLYLAIFYALYYVLLRRETFHQANRAFLLSASLLAFVIPLVQVDFLKPVEPAQVNFAAGYTFQPVYTSTQFVEHIHPDDGTRALLVLYIGIASVLLVNLFIKIYRLIKLSRQNSNTRSGNYYIVETSEDRDAFSFFNYMFISPQLAARQTVIDHELIHIRQKHSWDIIYTELLKIISWFNPVVYLLQHRVKELHEFIADNATVGGSQNTSAYTDFLVNNAYGVGDYSLVNTFFSKSLLKQRIIMLHQKRSGRSARLKYLVSLPVVAGLLCVSTLAFSKSYGWINVFANKKAASSANKRLLINSAVDKLSNVIDPKTINTAQFEQIIADFKQQGILMGYKYSKDENKKELLEISLKSLPGLGWKSNSGASATFRMDELLQGDYIILAGADTSSESLFVRTEKRVDSQSVDTNRIPPPPPPRAPRVTNVRFPAPNPPSSVTKKGYKYAESGFMVNGKTDFRVIIVEKDGSQKEYFKNVATPGEIKILNDKYGYIFPAKLAHPKMPPPPPPPAAGDIDKRPPPPPPAPPGDADGSKNQPPPPMEPFKPLSNNFSNLGSYLAKTVRYPAVALSKEITGSVIISFSVDGTNGIDNIIVEKGIGYRCDEEAVRAFKSYKATLKTNPGSYKIAVTYLINGLTPPKPASAELGSDPQFIGEVSVMGYPGK